MNKPSGLGSFFLGAPEGALGSVQPPPLLKVLRPASFALWLCLFCAQAITLTANNGSTNWMILVISTVPFVLVHLQFWYQESEQGRRFHHTVERARGRVYEDDLTALPNSRHFVFELRRQMTRSVRSGHGFSLVLAEMAGLDAAGEPKALPAVGRAIRHTCSEGDFVAHLEGPVFGAIVVDDDRAGAEKASAVHAVLTGLVPSGQRGAVTPVVTLTGYQGELEVRDFLRRAQRDLLTMRAQVPGGGEARTHSAA